MGQTGMNPKCKTSTLLRIGKPEDLRFATTCSCGWTSRNFSTAGLAHSAWDHHREKLNT